jgi:hypothetical protein
MFFVRFPVVACRKLAVVLAAITCAMVGAGPGNAADFRIAAVRPAPASMASAPSGAELVGKLLAERSTSSDPDVPLPQRDLTSPEPSFTPLRGPQLYGRGAEGSVVVGLKIPIPVDRGRLPHDTRYGEIDTRADTSGGAR